MERDILKRPPRTLPGVVARYALMDTLRRRFSLSMMCRVLRVSRSGFYAWRRRPPSKRRRQMVDRPRFAPRTSAPAGPYGPSGCNAIWRAHGVRVGVHRIKRIPPPVGLRCRQKRRYRATTDSRHALPVAPNVLGPCFRVQRPNQAWVGDITDVATDEGWLWLAPKTSTAAGSSAMRWRITGAKVS